MAVMIAWRWITWIDWFGLSGSTFNERIANRLWWTRTDGAVIDGMADGCIAARTRAWINAFGVRAGLVARTIRADGAFGVATGTKRITVITRYTFAHGIFVGLTAHGVQTAWRWITWIAAIDWLLALHHYDTMTECVAGGSRWTRTDRYVIGDRAHGFDAASARTWILTAITYACLVHWTVRVADTFGATAFVWISMVFGYTFADGVFVVNTTMGVDAAWRWIAWILFGFV